MSAPRYAPGTLLRVRALKPIRVGRVNRAAVRKGDLTTARVLRPLPGEEGFAQSVEVVATVPGMGNGYAALPPFAELEVLQVLDHEAGA